MRACGRCGHDNAPHLAYCVSCGRRLESSAVRPDASTLGLAATVALPHPRGDESPPPGRPPSPPSPPSAWRRLSRALAGWVSGARGADPTELKRRLLQQREASRRQIQETYAAFGESVAGGEVAALEWGDLVAGIRAAKQRRDAAAAAQMAAAEQQRLDDARRVREQETAEAEWKACVRRVADLDQDLQALDAERQQLDDDAAAESRGGSAPQFYAARSARQAELQARYAAGRERAAATRAAATAAERRFEQATAARREADAATAVTVHARERAEAEAQIRELTMELGRRAIEVPSADAPAGSGAWEIRRLQQIVSDCDEQINQVDRLLS